MKSLLRNTKFLSTGSSKSFSFLAGVNREVNPSQVTKLAESLNAMRDIRPVIVATISFITGIPVQYIIDGQHLFLAMIRNNAEIPYLEIEITDMEDLVHKLALCNASSKSWLMLDYVKVWQTIRPDYTVLMKFFKIYDIELMQLAEILHKGFSSSITNSTITKTIKMGQFSIVNLNQSKIMLDCITDVLKIVPRNDRMSNKALICSYTQFFRGTTNYNHVAFLKRLALKKDMFKLATQDLNAYKLLLESI